MRTLLKVQLPVEAGNRAVNDGTLPETIETLTQTLRPETAYFYTENGRRTAQFVFDLKDTTTITTIVEPLFRALEAEVTLTPVLTTQELQRGLERTHRGRELAGAR